MSRKLTCLGVLCVAVGASLSVTGTRCRAQWVDISAERGVYVRAPFVSVYVDPYGGTSVRAPFTAVDVPGRGFSRASPPVVVERRVLQPSFPTASELSAMNDGALKQFLRSTGDQLHVRLSRFNTGATWQRYLQLPEEALSDSSWSSHDRREALTELLGRFRYVASDPQYERIADLPAFAAMRGALTELVSRPDASPGTGKVPDEELPVPDPGRSRRSRPFLNPASGPEYSGTEPRDRP